MGKEGFQNLDIVTNYFKKEAKNFVTDTSFTTNPISIDIKKEKTNRPKGYEKGNIFSKEYSLSELSNNESLIDDLVLIKKVYSYFKENILNGNYEKTVYKIIDGKLKQPNNKGFHLGDENNDDLLTIAQDKEGKRIKIYGYKYERKPYLRKKAIEIHGTSCKVCGFNFENKFGELGKGFIEVHHVNPLYLNDGEKISIQKQI